MLAEFKKKLAEADIKGKEAMLHDRVSNGTYMAKFIQRDCDIDMLFLMLKFELEHQNRMYICNKLFARIMTKTKNECWGALSDLMYGRKEI